MTAPSLPPVNAPSSRLKRLFLNYRVEALVLLIGIVAMNVIFLARAFRVTRVVSPEGAGLLGDFVGGYVGTFFALLGVVLLTATLRSQRESSALLAFEAKYFELLRLHRENVAELQVQGVRGRKLFVVLIREFRSALGIVKVVLARNNIALDQKQVLSIAYWCLYLGTGPNSSRMLRAELRSFPDPFVNDLLMALEDPQIKQDTRDEKQLDYVPFEGHQSRLGHYFRHLFQAVRYVDESGPAGDKYKYTKTIRAQLSNHEQAILLLNSLTRLGRNWWRTGFLSKYRMVKNLPREFFDPMNELDVAALFPPKYFEWENELGVPEELGTVVRED